MSQVYNSRRKNENYIQAFFNRIKYASCDCLFIYLEYVLIDALAYSDSINMLAWLNDEIRSSLQLYVINKYPRLLFIMNMPKDLLYKLRAHEVLFHPILESRNAICASQKIVDRLAAFGSLKPGGVDTFHAFPL